LTEFAQEAAMRRRNRIPWLGSSIAALLAAAAALDGCGGGSVGGAPNSGGGPSITNGSWPIAVAQAQKADTPVNPAIVAADNGFGLSLLKRLISDNGGNVAISPISVALVLQIIYNGAAGTTQQAMARALQLGSMSAQDLNNANAALQASLIKPDPNVQLTMANSLWMHLNDNPVSPSFIATNESYYGAKVGDLSGAPDNVNAWVASETKGLITQILPAEPPGYYQSQDVTAVIANAVYFKGQWTTAFDAGQTASAPFTLRDGTSVPAKMMHQTGHYGYLKGVDFQAVRLAYGQGRLSMLLILPDSGSSLDGFATGITPQVLNGWIAQFQTLFGSIALPRFTTRFGVSLPSALTSLGMGIAFCPNPAADFSGIAPLRCLAAVEHRVVVEVDESGTVAAGATTGTIGVTAVETPQFTMTLDRPFFYAIRDDKTGELLFAGVMQDPSQR
jgi:serpin B